jgi:hypothetical protein
MNEQMKVRITIGLLAFFATIWILIARLDFSNLLLSIGIIILQLVLMLVLSYVIIGILEWVDLFDLQTNAILTLVVLVTMRLISNV